MAVTLVSGSLVFAPGASAHPVIAEASLEWEDGLNHFIVMPDGAPVPQTPAETELEPPAPAAAPTITQATPAAAPVATASESWDGGELPEGWIQAHSPDGKTKLAITPDGRIVSAADGSLYEPAAPKTTTPTTEPEPVAPEPAAPEPTVAPLNLQGGADGRKTSEAFADELRRLPQIKTAAPMYGGAVSVATSLGRAALGDLPGVGTVEEDSLLQLGAVEQGTPSDPLFASQWMHRNTGNGSQAGGYGGTPGADVATPTAWANSTGLGVVVADIDSGVQTDHPDLAAGIWRNPREICGNSRDDDANGYVDDCNGWDFGDGDNNPNPTGSGSFGAHGTHVAGIIGARGDNGQGLVGMAPDARIMPVKSATGNNLSSSALITAIYYAVDNGATVINASWGTPPGAASRLAVYYMEDAVAYAQRHGVTIVAAAGNDAVNIDQYPTWPASFSRYYDNVVTVGASTNGDARASFSNYGVASTDIFAPGWFINSTMPGSSYGMMSGTSMASPCVAGAVALIKSRNPGWTPTQVRTKLRESAKPVSAFGGLSKSGRLDAASAVSVQPLTTEYRDLDTALPDTEFTTGVSLQASNATLASQMRKLQLNVATLEGGTVYSVADLRIEAAGRNVTTDDGGSAIITDPVIWDKTTADMSFTMTLPAGEYAFIAQLLDASGANPTNGSVVFFSVANPADSGGGSTDGVSNGSGASSGGSTGGGGSAGGKPGAPSPGNPSPGSPSPGTPAPGASTPGNPTPTPGTPNPGASSGGSTTSPGSGGSSGGGVAAQPGRPGLPGGGTPPASGGGSSGQGPTTSQPPVTVPPTTQPPTTQPPVTTAPPSGGGGATQPADPAPVESNGWRIELVRPRSGPTSGGTLVHITGRFPDPAAARVDIGGEPAYIAWSSSYTILAWAPAHASGVFGVTVRGNDAEVTMPNVFTYTAPDRASGNNGGTTGTNSGNGGSAAGGTTGSGSTGGGSTGGGATGGGSTDSGSAPQGPAGPPNQIQRGTLRLVRPPAGSPIASLDVAAWPTAICRTNACPGRPV